VQKFRLTNAEVHPVICETLDRLLKDGLTVEQIVALADIMHQRSRWTGSYGPGISEAEYLQAMGIMRKAKEHVGFLEEWHARRGY